MKLATFIFLLVFSPLLPVFAQISAGQPTFLVIKQGKPDICPSGGLALYEGYVKAAKDDAYVDVAVFVQRYDGNWDRINLRRKGSGIIRMETSSCDYTGNYYAFACYSRQCDGVLPSSSDVKNKHERQGDQPKFRMTKREQKPGCDNGPGMSFLEGEIFTPRGEPINLTVFVERKDGSWRKKHYNYTGSGFINIDIEDCDLTGNYKFAITFSRR